MNDQNRGLAYLCGAYLHQDYHYDGEWDDVVSLFATENGDSILLETVADIDVLLPSDLSDVEIWRSLWSRKLAIDVRHEGWTAKNWLDWIKTVVLEELERRQRESDGLMSPQVST